MIYNMNYNIKLVLVLILILLQTLETTATAQMRFIQIEQTRIAAEKGDANAQCDLGLYYMYEKTPDYSQAVNWFFKAANQDNAKAQYNLGCAYESGLGVKQDYLQAVYWFRKSAEQEFAEAQNALGFCYTDGKGVVQDYKQAVYWCSKAANQGLSEAECQMGYLYQNGYGVKEDKNMALYWYKKGIDNNDGVISDQNKTEIKKVVNELEKTMKLSKNSITTENINGSDIISLTLSNLISMIDMPLDRWKQLMSSYYYTQEGLRDNLVLYVSGTRSYMNYAGGQFFSKSITSPLVEYTIMNQNTHYRVKEQLVDFISSISNYYVNSQNGWNIYIVKINNINYQINILGDSGHSRVVIWKM